jgi:hypothetical protein
MSAQLRPRQQVWALNRAPVADVRDLALPAVTGNLGKPVRDLRVPSALSDQPVEPVAPVAAALSHSTGKVFHCRNKLV